MAAVTLLWFQLLPGHSQGSKTSAVAKCQLTPGQKAQGAATEQKTPTWGTHGGRVQEKVLFSVSKPLAGSFLPDL